MDEEHEKSLPLERVFWEDLFDDALLWGLETYEQDWLDRQYMFTRLVHSLLNTGLSTASIRRPRSLLLSVALKYMFHIVMLEEG